MGVYIKGMEMPKCCAECKAEGHYEDYYGDEYGFFCPFGYKAYTSETRELKRLDDCPLVPVPPHGDLIERDALRASIRESIEECHKWADEVDKDTMMYARISQSLGTFVECSLRAKAAPTIIPAEEGE